VTSSRQTFFFACFSTLDRLLAASLHLTIEFLLTMFQLSLESPEKLKRTARWLTELRRKVELFNRCVVQCDDENSMRMEMSEVFSPLLGIFHDTIVYQQRYYASGYLRKPTMPMSTDY
jgi:hypothetical protein